jgi:adenylyltransferase/sulfurtransferase
MARRPGTRFDRQVRFAPLGERGQALLESRRVLLVGCGALGGILAQSLTRAGVGHLRLVDRDIVEETNLPRQVLYDAEHARTSALKVEAARETLARIGGPTELEPRAVHLDADNIDDLAEGCDLILDGTDNLSTRYLINDYCIEERVPWIFGAVVAGGGLVLPVLPGRGPCLRCVFDSPPPAGSLPTCDTAGVILPAVGLVASMQAGLALRLLARDEEDSADEAGPPLEPALFELDAWDGALRRLALSQRADCACCVQGKFPYLHEPLARRATILCGRNAVQVRGNGQFPDLDGVCAGLEGLARDVRRSGPLLRFSVEDYTLTVFPDGRALIEGTDDIDRALALYDRFVGS